MTPDASGGAVCKAGGQKIRPTAWIKPLVMLFEDAGVDQGLAQPVDRLLWPAKLFIQLGRCQRGWAF